MKTAIGTVLKALIIASLWGSIGVGVNVISAEPVPWIYEPQKSVDIAGIRVLLMDENRPKRCTAIPTPCSWTLGTRPITLSLT